MKPEEITLLALLALTLTGCYNDHRGEISPTQQPNEDKNYEVKFLFEVDSVKVYRFFDAGRYVYFTNANGNTEYYYTNGKAHTRIQSVNNADCPCREKGGVE